MQSTVKQTSHILICRRRRFLPTGGAFLFALTLVNAPCPAAFAADATQKHFASPEEASKTLVAALKAGDNKTLLAIFGANAGPLVESGDPIADAAVRARFVRRYDETSAWVKSGDDTQVLQIGKNEWPFPIPLVKSADGWHFDSAAGSEEIIDRRIGRNELATIQVCLAYVDAQREYYASNPDKDPLPHYAQKLASTPGKHDGLYWPAAAGEPQSPLGPLMANARAEGYEGKAKHRPYHGYSYRILTAQGPDAPGGAYDYVVPGKQMIGGFAVVAYPAQYDTSGVMTFVVNHDGIVYEKDLGPETGTVAQAMSAFNPDKSWKPTTVDPGS